MDHLLVTGGAGFIGSAFVRHLLQHDLVKRVTVLDKLTYAGSEENLAAVRGDPRLRFVRGDICDRQLVDELAAQADAVANLAAESHVDRSLLDAGAFVQTDVYGTYVLADASRRFGHERFLQVSTDEVYGHVPAGRSREADPLRPRSPYAATKASAEMVLQAYRASYGLPVVITRGSNTYGPYQFPEKIVPLFITNALEGLPLPIYGDGSAVRDYLYVDDHAAALAAALLRGEAGTTYNVGAGQEMSGVDVANAVLEICGRPPSLKLFVSDRPGHDYRYAMDCSDIERLGWKPARPPRSGFEATVGWYREHEDWWRRRKSPEFWAFYRASYRGLPPDAFPSGSGTGEQLHRGPESSLR